MPDTAVGDIDPSQKRFKEVDSICLHPPQKTFEGSIAFFRRFAELMGY